jgi:outer membrane protein insertion porin family
LLIILRNTYLIDWTLGISLSQSRRRYFSFDADIQKTSYTLGNDLTSWLKFNFTQQLETISQYDTTVDREHGHFQIGSVTPELIFDFRNNRINPTKGSYFNLSYEVASPAFLSQSNDELEINYYKLTSRNRFYIPFRNGVLALSLSAGFQKNLATQIRTDSNGVTESEGYIPNIKVFRLAGMDIVRGFEDNEINRLVTGEDVSEARVDSKAYMANLKFEPRFYLSDSTMLGVFYDAGRVFVDTFNLDELRSSVGLSFKYLTPVGSLDFDYGIKLLRKKDNNGKLESPGRLHVSIGFF